MYLSLGMYPVCIGIGTNPLNIDYVLVVMMALSRGTD